MKTFSYLSIALGAVLVSACTVQNVSGPADLTNLEARAEQQAQAGNLASAAALYRQLADAASGSRRAGYLIEGASLLIERNDRGQAQRWLAEAAALGTREQQQHVSVLRARIALDQDQPDAALQILAGIADPIPVDVQRDLAAVRGLALMRIGRYADGIGALVEREIWLDSPADVLANQRMIWDGLRRARLDTAPPLTGDRIVDGWLALAPIAAVADDKAEFRRELLQWRAIYTDHPAAGGLLAQMLSEQRGAQAFVQRIALLLPLSSSNRPAAIAIRDGFLAAHLASGTERESTVRIYDTAQLGADEAYLRAQLEGADFIVGPLLRPNVDAIVNRSGFVPTLALNYAQVDTPLSTGFYQFALSYEDEARAVAQRAIANGARTAVALVASNSWGYQLRDSFREEFEALGGQLLDFSGFDPERQDFSANITSLLHIDRSNQRRRRLAANLGEAVEFEPRRRRDVDMIFLAADARAGRLLTPQLRFYSAGDIPTYATRDIYEPGDSTSNADLNGVLFPDAPILLAPDASSQALKEGLERYWPQRAKQWIRFYGMGFDAYGLMSSLYRSSAAAWPIEGASGELTMDERGRIHRLLPFAQFRGGQPVALERQPNEQNFLGAR
jgi:outer membrane PBP1 activator LpoA protein